MGRGMESNGTYVLSVLTESRIQELKLLCPQLKSPHTPLHVGLQAWDGHGSARYRGNLPSFS